MKKKWFACLLTFAAACAASVSMKLPPSQFREVTQPSASVPEPCAENVEERDETCERRNLERISAIEETKQLGIQTPRWTEEVFLASTDDVASEAISIEFEYNGLENSDSALMNKIRYHEQT